MDGMVKTLCIVQARLTSTRLPNKILRILGNSGKSLLEHVYERLSASEHIDKIMFAIPYTPSNDSLAQFLDNHGFDYVRGDEENVLSRFIKAAEKYNPEVIVRATCDNPCVDWRAADDKLSALEGHDYVSGYGAPLGTSVEAFRYEALLKAYKESKDPAEHEHVTPYLYRNPDMFSIVKIPYYMEVKRQYRLTVDTVQDFEVANIIYQNLYAGNPIENAVIYEFLENHPEVMALNAEVEQKTL